MALVLDRPRPRQQLPVGGDRGEAAAGRGEQHLGAAQRQRPRHLRLPQLRADQQPEPDAERVEDAELLAGRDPGAAGDRAVDVAGRPAGALVASERLAAGALDPVDDVPALPAPLDPAQVIRQPSSAARAVSSGAGS